MVMNLDFHKVISDLTKNWSTRCRENTEIITISTELIYVG
jgi:hypothetical protein